MRWQHTRGGDSTSKPVSPLEVVDGGADQEDFAEIMCEEPETEEARAPEVLRDPGAPTEKEVEEHNVTHLPFRTWCPHCVAGKAQDRPHREVKDQDEKQVPEIVFDYGFLGGKEDAETLAVQVARDRRTKMLFANVVPRKGMVNEHGAQAMLADLDKLGYKDIILKCDGEPAMKSVQEEVKRRRADNTILENSIPGDSQSNGAAERAVKAVGEQVRVLRAGLQARLGLVVRANHPVMTWLIQHSADCISKYHMGEDGKTAYERLKGKRFSRPAVEFGEKIHYKRSVKGQKAHKLDGKWSEGFFLGFYWKTSEAIVGTSDGIKRAGTIRRVGAHRRWDGDGLDGVRGVPWKWDPDAEEVPDKLLVRMLSEDEKKSISGPVVNPENKTVYRMRLRRDDFLQKGFTEGCPGCQAILAGSGVRGHSEVCRRRMEGLMQDSEEGKARLKRQTDRENEYLTRVLEKHDEEELEQARKKAKTDPEVGQPAPPEPQKPDPDADGEGDRDMDVSHVERLMQDDLQWSLNTLEDMCVVDDPELQRYIADYSYFDENTWEELDPVLVHKGERDEYERFCKMGVYEYCSRRVAEHDAEGKFVKVKWVRTKKGGGVRCRLVAQELGYGERLDELFAGTPSLGSVRLALAHAMTKPNFKIMVMDVKCAFLYGEIQRSVYIELPHVDPKYGDGSVVGKLRKSMYGTRDAPQIWGKVVQNTLENLGYAQSVYQPAVYYSREKDVMIIVHVDDFLCVGDGAVLENLHVDLNKSFEVKKTMLSMEDERETSYLNRRLVVTERGVEIISDTKHSDLLLKEWSLQEFSKDVATPSLKELEDAVGSGEELSGDLASKARRGIARISYMSQDRPDLSAVAKVMSQHMAKPRDGVVLLLKRCIRYIKRYPVGALLIPREVTADENVLTAWTDSDWAGDVDTRKSTSGGFVVYRGAVVSHWSKSQSNVALSSAEAELNACVKGLSELIGIYNLINETLGFSPVLALCTDASACKGMLLRHGTGKVKHLSVKQLWSQEVVSCYGVQVQRVTRAANPADLLTHCVTFPTADRQLMAINFMRRKAAVEVQHVQRVHRPGNAILLGELCAHDPGTGVVSEGGCRGPHSHYSVLKFLGAMSISRRNRAAAAVAQAKHEQRIVNPCLHGSGAGPTSSAAVFVWW